MAEVTYVTADDWCGIYADGELVTEGHSLSPFEVLLPFVNAHIESVARFEIYPFSWLDDRGSLPESLDEIPQEVRRA